MNKRKMKVGDLIQQIQEGVTRIPTGKEGRRFEGTTDESYLQDHNAPGWMIQELKKRMPE